MNHVKRAQGIVRELINDDIARYSKGNVYLERHFSIQEVTTYSLNSGKRLRPIIIGSIGQWRNPHFVLFIEYVHNSSLIVDDLPCMDNDTERRGLPTVHKKYGEHVAQLTAYNFMITAMKHLSDGIEMIRSMYRREDFDMLHTMLNREVKDNLGYSGICGGQMIDLLLEKEPIYNCSPREQKTTILEMVKMKTGCLFGLSFVLGWISIGGSMEAIESVKQAGYNFGICYQIIDDLRDIEKDKARNGCSNNICRYFTRNEIIDMFTQLNAEMVKIVSQYGFWNHVLHELNRYLIKSFKEGIKMISI